MKILILEDLDTFYEAIREGLKTQTDRLGTTEIVRYETELQFRDALESGFLINEHFDVAIFDVMVGWCTNEEAVTEKGQHPPQEVRDELALNKPWRSGVRCKKMFTEQRTTNGSRKVPCLYYSVLDPEGMKDELDGDAELVVKQGGIDHLVEAIMRTQARP